MKSSKSSRGLVGTIIIEVILFFDLAADMYTGELNCTDLASIITLTMLLAIPFIIIIRKIRQKRSCGATKKNRGEVLADNAE